MKVIEMKTNLLQLVDRIEDLNVDKLNRLFEQAKQLKSLVESQDINIDESSVTWALHRVEWAENRKFKFIEQLRYLEVAMDEMISELEKENEQD